MIKIQSWHSQKDDKQGKERNQVESWKNSYRWHICKISVRYWQIISYQQQLIRKPDLIKKISDTYEIFNNINILNILSFRESLSEESWCQVGDLSENLSRIPENASFHLPTLHSPLYHLMPRFEHVCLFFLCFRKFNDACSIS